MLTDTAIKKLKPSDKCTHGKVDKYTDGNGLQLWVRHTGVKSWVIAYRWHGKQQSMTIGTYPTISLQQARIHALSIKEKIKQGIDPKHAKPSAVLFGDVAHAYHESRNPASPANAGKKTVTPSTYQKDFNLYQRDIAPKLAHIDVKAITPAMVFDVISAIDKRGAGDMARRANRQIGAIYDHAIIHDQFNGISPHKGLEKRLQERTERHFARIEFNELNALFADIDHSNCEPLTKLAIRFICYTMVRTIEMRFMTWQEIDWQACLWRIPAKRMKMGKEHIIPLSSQAIEILQTIKAMGLSDEFVFYNTVSKAPVSENFITSALKRLGWQGKMTGHGFRGLASTTLHERQYIHEAIELQLAHQKKDKVAGAYDHAKHIPYRQQMMQEWADMIDGEIGKINYLP
ncbi:tyrosine-type recombinase/integrase [Moraxella pluranimalium]|uniref:tyrosine-type recombinase/integrase n=1 Tax=Moraxella pluranimalium TaxID=470453 RepID=UPI0009933C49|nr:site-specific integrase [Moraxella pluranimalium]